MGGRVDRRNRVGFTLLGLVLLGLGIVGLLARQGGLELAEPASLYDGVAAEAAARPGLTTVLLLIAGLLLIVLGLLLVRGQLRRGHAPAGELALQRGEGGSTTVTGDALSEALERDLERLPGVRDVTVVVLGGVPVTRVRVRASVDGQTNIPGLREAMEGSYERLRRAVGAERVETDLHLRQVFAQRARVR